MPNAITVIGANTPELLPFRVTATTVVGGCTASDYVNLKVFKITSDILVPTAFTPNNDGKNDVLKPILIGMKRLDFFTMYNRFGQVVFTTSDSSKGWNGNINGVQQPTGIYVILAQGVDYSGKKIVKQGTVVLLR